MKNLILGYSFILLLLFTACNQNPKAESNTTESDSASFKMVSFFKTSSECDKDTCGAYVTASYPEFKDSQIQKFVNKIITNDTSDRGNLRLEILADSFIAEFVKFRKDYPEAVGGYEWIQSLKVKDNKSNLITFIHSNYSYTGGAHGLETTSYYNYAKEENRSLKLEDLLKPNQYQKLVSIAEEIFRKDEKLSPDQSLEDQYFFENAKFVLNGNFLITDKGLLFTYNPYEIKAYAFGTTDLLIPYERIKDIINPDSILATYVK